MKLITRSSDIHYLESLKVLLESNGIPTYISGKNTARMITSLALTQPSLWVHFDDQLEEAESLIENPNYDVKNKVDMEEFYAVTQQIEGDNKKLGRTFLELGFFVLTVLLIMLLVYKLLGYL